MILLLMKLNELKCSTKTSVVEGGVDDCELKYFWYSCCIRLCELNIKKPL